MKSILKPSGGWAIVCVRNKKRVVSQLFSDWEATFFLFGPIEKDISETPILQGRWRDVFFCFTERL